jgi:hypothetical protein
MPAPTFVLACCHLCPFLPTAHAHSDLEGTTLDWYHHDLESKVKVSWPLFPWAFVVCWKPITFNIHAVKVLLNLTPGKICQPPAINILPTVN